MLRRVLLGVLLALALFSVASGSASAFNPATQSHWGACARETQSVAQAVHDYAANGVAVDFARLVGLRGRDAAVVKQLRRRLVIGTVERRVVTQNHGCDGAGAWFAVGPRVLSRGEPVGVRLGERLRQRVCVRSHRDCRRITLRAHVVFPTNCWNPNMGAVRIAVYVHRVVHRRRAREPKPKPKPRHEVAAYPPQAAPPSTPTATSTVTSAQPQASAALDCASAAVNVTIANAAAATAPASFEVQGAAHGPLAPGTGETIALPLKLGEKLTLTVASGSATLIAGEQIVNECRAEPVASAKFVRCVGEAAGPSVETSGARPAVRLGPGGPGIEVAVTVANRSSADLPASFAVDWVAFSETGPEPETRSQTVGPLAPGEQKTIDVELGLFRGTLPSVTVSSGGEQILDHKFGFQMCLA